jgi:hypothetical protein
MMTEALKPRDGEPLAAFVNRVRPEGTPSIAGQPAYNGDRFVWQAEGWTVLAEIDEAGGVTVHWEAPEGHDCIGYTLGNDGARRMAVNRNGDSEQIPGWPVAA